MATDLAATGMPLLELLATQGLAPPATWQGDWPLVRGICLDSRQVRAGDLFVAIVGERFDGRRFAQDAVARGAVAILGPAADTDDLDVPWIVVDDPRGQLGALAMTLYSRPHERLLTVGVTGTNGKTSVMTLLASILEAAGQPTGVLGTLGYSFGDRVFTSAGRTTPEAPEVHRMLDAMARQGAAAAVMEVSSHALEVGRVDGVLYDLAVFTNLSRDHLDFHGDMDSYFAAKRRLFERLKKGARAVVHVGADSWSRQLVTDLRQSWNDDSRLLTCGLGAEGSSDVDVKPIAARVDVEGIRATFKTPVGELSIRSSLLGHFHLENLLTAATGAIALGLPLETIEKGLTAANTVPGRLERVPGDIVALVDYAHTPAALEAALKTVRKLSDQPIIALFGCGGERDRGKRPEMGRIAGEQADLPILTSDNPRREDPAQILADAEAGLRQSGCALYLVEPDRRAAIEKAVARARAGGFLVMVTGKGHEASQDLGDRVVPFDDRQELAIAMTPAAMTEEVPCG